MKKFFSLILALAFICLGASSALAASGIYGATCRLGGGACVDGIDVTDPKGDGSNIGLAAGDMCFVVVDAGTTQPELYIYRLYASGTAESDPIVIQPNTVGGEAYSGTLRWHLVTPVGAGLGSAAVDGQNRIYITNNTWRTPTASANELYPVGNAWTMAENGSVVGNVVSTSKAQTLTNKSVTALFVDGHTDATNLTAAQVSGTIIYNTGQGAGDVTLNLPAAAAGYNSLFTVGTTVAANKWRVKAQSGEYIYNMAADGTPTIGSSGGYVGYSTTAKYPVIGNSFACWTFQISGPAWAWACKPVGNIVLTAE